MQTEPLEDDELDLRAYLGVLRRRWRWIAASVILVVALALAVSFQQSATYQATAEVLIRQRSTESLFNEEQLRVPADAARLINNEVELIESGTVRDLVAVTYDGALDVDDISAGPASDTSDAVRISATGGDPDAVAELVNLYTETYIEFSRTQRVDDLLAAGAEIQAQVDDLQVEINEVSAPLAELDAEIAADPENEALSDRRDSLAASVAAETTTLGGQQDFYEQQMENLELTAGIVQSGGVQLLTAAEPPADPISPKPVRNAALALVLGGLLGVFLAFVRDRLDDTIRSPEDLDRVAPGALPTIGLIPALDDARPGLIVETDPKSPTAEAYRTLRTAVRFAGIDRKMKTLQVTSSNLGEGKTTTVANLAVALAQAGQRVAIVCCDLRRPRVHELFGEDISPGFTDVLLGEVVLADALRSVRPNLYLLAAGSRPPNPSERLGSARAESVLAALAAECDYLVIDSTPILPVTDGLVVAHLADATLVVVSARTTTRQQIRQTMTLLGQTDASVIGFVLNRIPLRGRGGYGYSYAYAYTEAPARKPRAPR
ncbi:MAG: polysaccharide biosynthesis tyrosine autokinase, partial [Acidimicrobiia bacterium]|nr:polysaccharide biosynthesis tyrosine autokinase [Acidimicrobiia bacterium]